MRRQIPSSRYTRTHGAALLQAHQLLPEPPTLCEKFGFRSAAGQTCRREYT